MDNQAKQAYDAVKQKAKKEKKKSKNDVGLGATIKTIKDRKKMLDDI